MQLQHGKNNTQQYIFGDFVLKIQWNIIIQKQRISYSPERTWRYYSIA